MKQVLTFALVVAACASSMARSNPDEARIQRALETLRTEPSLFFRLDGFERRGTGSTRITSDLYWKVEVQGERTLARAELLDYRNNALQGRSVADGTTYWNYHLRTREYSGTPYGRYDSEVSQQYVRDLLGYLNAGASPAGGYITRLLRETFAGSQALYRSWMPGVTPTSSGDTIEYALGEQVRRRIQFVMESQQDGSERLRSVRFYDRTKVGTLDRETDWTITIYTGGDIPPGENFQPYTHAQTRGWKAVPMTRPRG